MRADMNKVLVLRGRGGAGYNRMGRKRRWAQEIKREPMSRGRGSKYLGENLAPLRRYLLAQAGRPFDNVYSEIRQHINTGNVVQQHILQHLWDFVERHPIFVDGVPHSAHGGNLVPLYRRRWQLMHVSADGVLRENPTQPRQRRRD